MPDAPSYSEAWRNFHNFVAQFGPHIAAITDALDRAASVEKYLADTKSDVEARDAQIKNLDSTIAAKQKEIQAQEAMLTANKQDYNDAIKKVQDTLADLVRQHTLDVSQHEKFKATISAEKLALSKDHDAVAASLAAVNAELAAKTAQLSATRKRLSAASAALG
jgi:septal ring factor EnvC (AmiA/AmiB activator)